MALRAKECADCGSDPVFHLFTYITVAIDETLRPLFAPGPIMRVLIRLAHNLEKHATPAFFRLCIRLGIAKELHAPDDKTILLAKVLWEEAEKRGITMSEVRLFNLPRNVFLATLPNGTRIAFEGMPVTTEIFRQAWWLDNKAEMKKRFLKKGIPVAKGGAALTVWGAKNIWKKVTPPVIAKPYSGSGSRHTILHINDETELLRAFRVAREVAPLVVIEEELVGAVYRATVVDGKLIGVLRRDPPHVVGDGLHTILELMEEANKNPERGGLYFSKMLMNPAYEEELSWQGLTGASVPSLGQRVTLHQKVNWALGGTTADVTDETHPDNVALFEKVAHVLHAPVVGLDFIIADMNRSWKEQERAGVIECNSMPFFDNHHLPFEGKPRNVAGAIWDMIGA